MSETLLQPELCYPRVGDLPLWASQEFQEVVSEHNLHRILVGTDHGDKAFLKIPGEPREFVTSPDGYVVGTYQNHAAYREAMSLCVLSESTLSEPAPYQVPNCIDKGYLDPLLGHGFVISSYVPGMSLSGDMVRRLSIAEQQDIGKVLGRGVAWFSRAFPSQEFARIIAEAPYGYKDAGQRAVTDAEWNDRLSVLYDAGYECLTDEILRNAWRYEELSHSVRPNKSFIGQGNMFIDNVHFVKQDERWRVNGLTGFSRVGPSCAARELAFLYGFGEHALAAGVKRYKALTGSRVNEQGLQFWVRVHLAEACAKTVLHGGTLNLAQRQALEYWIPESKWSSLPEATTDPELPLRRVRALCLPLPPVSQELLGTQRGKEWSAFNSSVEASIVHANKLGAAVVNLFDTQDYETELQGLNTQAYLMYNTPLIDEQRTSIEEDFFNGDGRDILRPRTEFLAECGTASLLDRLQAGESFVLAYPAAHRGNCKYLIEEPWQLERVLQFCADHSNQNWPDVLEVRQFIETPSDRYTSYRSMITVTGRLLASSLSCSAHTKYSGNVVENDRLEQTHGAARQLKAALEDPVSPYFLQARDIRSNAADKRMMIPLMGPALLQPVGSDAVGVLLAHGIDPENRALPGRVLREAQLVGRALGPTLDIMLGIDHIPDQSSSYWLTEWNSDPFTRTYVACGYSNDLLRALTEARLQAVESLSSPQAHPFA